METQKRPNVIDLTERIAQKNASTKMQNLKMRLDIEQMRVVIPASLLSILLLVTLANNSLTNPSVQTVQMPRVERGIASISTGTSAWEDGMVAKLRNAELGPTVLVSQKPSLIQQLAIGYFEGRYAIRLQAGQIQEIHLTDKNTRGPKVLDNRESFLMQHRDVLPPFSFLAKPEIMSAEGQSVADGQITETYDLLDKSHAVIARVQFRLDAQSHLYSMKVLRTQIAAK